MLLLVATWVLHHSFVYATGSCAPVVTVHVLGCSSGPEVYQTTNQCRMTAKLLFADKRRSCYVEGAPKPASMTLCATRC